MMIPTTEANKTNYQVAAIHLSGGPFPSPEVMLKYKEIDPELYQTIVSMGKSQFAHRQKIESINLESKLATDNEIRNHLKRRDEEAKRGQYLGFSIALVSTIGGIYAALNGSVVAGIVIGSIGVSSIVSTLIIGRIKENK